MKEKSMFKILEMILLAIAVSILMVLLVRAMQAPHQILPTLATVSWNG